jgi:hypothetical protein
MLAVEMQLVNAGMRVRQTLVAPIDSRMQQPAQQQQQLQGLRVKAAARVQSGTTSGTSSSICGGSSLVEIEIWSSS